jgi:hypothetical protein
MITLSVINAKRYHSGPEDRAQGSHRGELQWWNTTHHEGIAPTDRNSFTGRPINGSLLLAVSEAAAALGISRSSIYRLCDAGELA